MGENVQALVRIASEVNTKSNSVRRQFARRLCQNIRTALGPACIVKRSKSWGRIYVEAPERSDLEPLANVFGIASYSPVTDQTNLNVKDIVAKAVEVYSGRVGGKVFAVRCRRGNVPGMTSMEIEREVGSALYPFAAGVNLSQPEVVVHIDVRQEGAFFFDDSIPGPGGLPLGVQGKALCLMSGGFDSPVAAWYVMKRGVELDFLFLNLAGAAYERSVIAVTRALCEGWSHGYKPRLYSVPGEGIANDIRTSVAGGYAQLVLKRVMYRLASTCVAKRGGYAIVTGEAIGQVSSQTMSNLAAIEPAASVPVLRPLIGFDKNDIIELSRRIGTHELSEHMQEYCNLVAHKPLTRALAADVDVQELGVSSDTLAEAAAGTKVHHIMKLDLNQLMTDYLFVDQVPEGAEVIDCRSQVQYGHWHYPGSRNQPLDVLLRSFRQLERSPTYILYCPYGLQSAVAAEKMQKIGYDAYSFRGGVRALKSYVESQSQA